MDHHTGVWPVMLTPFTEDREIDWASLERLIDWYIASGVHGLFANCQSSEMFFLSDAESEKLTRFVVDYVDGRVPVVASGHTGNAPSHQAEQLAAQAACGVDSVIMISNRLASQDEGDEVFLERLAALTEKVPASAGIGVYECPYPYKRLLSDAAVSFAAKSGRFTFLKDTCCNIETLTRRAKLVEGSQLHIANANAQTLLASLKVGCHGYSGVMANFHPALYVWLTENWQSEPEKAEILGTYLSVAAMTESMDYPLCAKDFQKAIGNFSSMECRTRPLGGYFQNHFSSTVSQMIALGETLASQLELDIPAAAFDPAGKIAAQ
ncbi:dihydrodipicolinate synthase family protein [Martelella alba]|uniref:Dihydrodipicolinate synthase family protein n=1 Tax=Martelella alba TaxID=2590451 RepID=A0A506UJG4_9HYPH|nr:dihydrodipicolinate synthase family protein [Martelella alba]TPW33471.1 dihydrodipicolinate synthase family protein [Martelella alba]